MLKNPLSKKTSVKSTTQIEPGIVLNIYAPNEAHAKSYLAGYAGEQRGNELFAQATHTTQIKKSEELKAGIEFQGSHKLPLGATHSFVAPVPENHIVDGAGAVRATQNGRVINININLAALPPLTGLESPEDLKRLQVQFDHTLGEVRERIRRLEVGSPQRDLDTRHPQPHRPQQSQEAQKHPKAAPDAPKTEKAAIADTPAQGIQSRQPKVSLMEAVALARATFGDDCAFVHESWQKDARVRVHSADHMLRIAKASQELKDRSALPAAYTVDTETGAIVNTLRGSTEFRIVTPRTNSLAQGSPTDTRLQEAIAEHFAKNHAARGKPVHDLPTAASPGGLA